MSRIYGSERSQCVIDSDGTGEKIRVASASAAPGPRRRASSWDDSDDELPSPSTHGHLQKGRIYSADSKANRETAVAILNEIKQQYFEDLRKQTEKSRINEPEPMDRRQSPARVRRRSKSSRTSSPNLESSVAVESFDGDEMDGWTECSTVQEAVHYKVQREPNIFVGTELHAEHEKCIDSEIGFEDNSRESLAEKLPDAADECLISLVEVDENTCGGFYCRTSRKLSKILEIDESRKDFESEVTKDLEIPEIDTSKTSIEASPLVKSYAHAEKKAYLENEEKKESNDCRNDRDEDNDCGSTACSEDGSGSSPLPTARTFGSCGVKNNLSSQSPLMQLSSRSTGNNLRGSISERCSKISNFDDSNLPESPRSAITEMDLSRHPENTTSKTLERFLRDYPMASTWIECFYKKGDTQSFQESLKMDLNLEAPVQVDRPVSRRSLEASVELDSVPPSPRLRAEIEVEASAQSVTNNASVKSWEASNVRELPTEESKGSFEGSERNVEHERKCSPAHTWTEDGRSPMETTEGMSERLTEPLVNYCAESPKGRESKVALGRESEPTCPNLLKLCLDEEPPSRRPVTETPSFRSSEKEKTPHLEKDVTELIDSGPRKTAAPAEGDDDDWAARKQVGADIEAKHLIQREMVDERDTSVKRTSLTNLMSPKSKSSCSARAKLVGGDGDELKGSNSKERGFTARNSTSSSASSRRSFTEKLSPISLTDIVERGSSSCFSSPRSKENDARGGRDHDTPTVSKHSDTAHQSEPHHLDEGDFPSRCQKVDRGLKSFGDGPSVSIKDLIGVDGGNNECFYGSLYETNDNIKRERNDASAHKMENIFSEKIAERLQEKLDVRKKAKEKGNRCRTERNRGVKDWRKQSLEEELWKKIIDTFGENHESEPGLLRRPEKFSPFFRGRHLEKRIFKSPTEFEMMERTGNRVQKKDGVSWPDESFVRVAEPSEFETSTENNSLQVKMERTGVAYAGFLTNDKDGVRMGEFGDITSCTVDVGKFPESDKPKDHGDGDIEEMTHCKAFSVFTDTLKRSKDGLPWTEGGGFEECLDCPTAPKNCKDKSEVLVSTEARRSKSQSLISRWETPDPRTADEREEAEKRRFSRQRGSPGTGENNNGTAKWSGRGPNQIPDPSRAPSTNGGDPAKICEDFYRLKEISQVEEGLIFEEALAKESARVRVGRNNEADRKLGSKTWLLVNKGKKGKKFRAKNKLEKRERKLNEFLREYDSTVVSDRTSYVTLLKLRKNNCFQSFYKRLIQMFCITSASSAATSK